MKRIVGILVAAFFVTVGFAWWDAEAPEDIDSVRYADTAGVVISDSSMTIHQWRHEDRWFWCGAGGHDLISNVVTGERCFINTFVTNVPLMIGSVAVNVSVGTGAANDSVWIARYDHNTRNYPDRLVREYGGVDVEVGGFKTIPCADTLLPGLHYFAARYEGVSGPTCTYPHQRSMWNAPVFGFGAATPAQSDWVLYYNASTEFTDPFPDLPTAVYGAVPIIGVAVLTISYIAR